MRDFVESIKRLYGKSKVVNDSKLAEWLENGTITQLELEHVKGAEV